MASAAEQLARNFDLRTLTKATELHKRLLFVVVALIIYRVGTYIPLPGIDSAVYAQSFSNMSGGIVGMLNALSGGAVERMAIFALNVMPYISASIVMQIMAATVPRLEKLKKEGEAGRKQINQYTRYLTVVLASVQALSLAVGFEQPNSEGQTIAVDPGLFFKVTTVVTLVSGTMLLMWIGEQITARGVGNGISLIIFAGIVAELPRGIVQALSFSQTEANAVLPLGLAVFAIAAIVFVVFMERSQRRLLVQYPKRQQGNRMFGGQQSFLPLKLNTAGVIPPIFASSLLLLPATIGGFSGGQAVGPEWWQAVQAMMGRGAPLYLLVYGAGIIFFCFVYTSIVFNPEDTADNLKKYGGFLPGHRPGKQTAKYLDHVLTRLTVIGAAYLTLVCLLPEFFIGRMNLPFFVGGTSLLIVVSVTMDTVAQVQSHLLAHQYEGLIKKTKMRGRKR